MSQQLTPFSGRPYIPIKEERNSSVTTKSFLFAQEHKIVEFRSSKIVEEWKLGFSGLKEKISCISYVPSSAMLKSVNSLRSSHPMKKAKQYFKSLESTILCGTHDSKILMWHENRLKSEWVLPSGSSVVSIASHPNKNGEILVLTSSITDPLYSINIFDDNATKTKNVSRKYLSAMKGEGITTIMTFINDDTLLLAIGTSTGVTYVMNLNSLDVIHTYMGHSSPVCRIAAHKDFIATCSESEAFVNIYKLSKSGNTPFKTFQTSREVSAVDIVVGDKSKIDEAELVDVAVICENNSVTFWRVLCNDSSGDLTTAHHTSTVVGRKNKGLILGVSLSNVGPEASITFGAIAQPSMSTVNYSKSKLELKSTKHKVQKDMAALNNQPDIKMNLVNVTGLKTGAKIDDIWPELNGDASTSKSLQEKLDEIPALSEGNQFQRMSQANLPTFNISQSLHQLVRTRRFRDQRMLDILDISDTEIIHSAVKSISEDHIFSFFSFLHNTLVDQDIEFWRMENIYLWINSILINHPSVIQRVGGIDKILSQAIHSVERKAHTYIDMLEISGRLDLLLSLAGNKFAGYDPLKDENVQKLKTIDANITIEDSDDEIAHIIHDEYDEEDELDLMTENI